MTRREHLAVLKAIEAELLALVQNEYRGREILEVVRKRMKPKEGK